MPKPVVVYDDMPPYTSHGWKYLADDHKGAFFIGFGPPFNIGIPPTSVSQIRRVNYTNGLAEPSRKACATASAATWTRGRATIG